MNTRFSGTALGAALVAWALSSLAQAQPAADLVPKATLGGDASVNTFDLFGGSIASDGDWLFIGAPQDPSSREKEDGAVYVYRKQTNGSYMRTPRIPPPETSSSDGDRFGAGVVAGGGWLFVAAANNQSGGPAFASAGKVFVYRLGGQGWDFMQSLTSPQPAYGGAFGARTLSKHMALNKDATRIVIGEPNIVPDANMTARMHLFARQGMTWSHIQPIDVETDTPTIDFKAADSIVWLGNHVVVKVNKVTFTNPNPNPNRRPLSSQGKLFVYRLLPDGMLSSAPTQIIDGTAFNTNRCAPDFSTAEGFGFAGMAAGGGVFAVTQPCLDTANGPQTGRLDIYTYMENQNAPLVLKESIDGPTRMGRLGSTLFGGQESVAVSDDGRRILVGAAIGGPRVQLNPSVSARADDVRLYELDQGRWPLRASFRPRAGAVNNRLFGQVVAFGHSVPGVDAATPLFVAEPGSPVAPNAGVVLMYEIPNGRP